jgi:hypothetical protein
VKTSIFVIFLLIAGTSLFGQETSRNFNCKWQKNEVDPFTGVHQSLTQWEKVGYSAKMDGSIYGNIKFAVSENISDRDTSFILWISTYTAQTLCFNDESKILIKSGETIIPIKLLGGIMCGDVLTSYGKIESNDINFLRQNTIDLLRIQFSGDGNTIINFDLKDVNRYLKLNIEYFTRTFKCFE